VNLSRSRVEASRFGSPSGTTWLRIPSRGWKALGLREASRSKDFHGTEPPRDQRQPSSQDLPGSRRSATVAPNTALQRTRSAPLRSPLSFGTFGATRALILAMTSLAFPLPGGDSSSWLDARRVEIRGVIKSNLQGPRK
jgi:hypothetical protein